MYIWAFSKSEKNVSDEKKTECACALCINGTINDKEIYLSFGTLSIMRVEVYYTIPPKPTQQWGSDRRQNNEKKSRMFFPICTIFLFYFNFVCFPRWMRTLRCCFMRVDSCIWQWVTVTVATVAFRASKHIGVLDDIRNRHSSNFPLENSISIPKKGKKDKEQQQKKTVACAAEHYRL